MFFEQKFVAFILDLVCITRSVVHHKVEQVLNACCKVITSHLQTYMLLLFVHWLAIFLILDAKFLIDLGIKFTTLQEYITSPKYFPIFFVLDVEFPLLLVNFRYHRILIQLINNDVVKYRHVHLHLPEIIKVFAVSLRRKRHVLLSEFSIKVMQIHKVTLIHHSKICPNLYHFQASMDQVVTFHFSLLVEHATHHAPQT